MPSAGRKGNYSVRDSGVRRAETKSDRGAVAALGRQGAPLEAQGAVPGAAARGRRPATPPG